MSGQRRMSVEIVRGYGLLDGRMKAALGLYALLTPLQAAADAASLLLLLAAFTGGDTGLGVDSRLAELMRAAGAPQGSGALLGMAVVLLAFKAAATVALSVLESWLQAQTRRGIQEQGMRRLLEGRWEDLRRGQVGQWTGALTEEAAIVSKYLQSAVRAAYAAVTFVIIAGMAFALSPRICLVLAALGIPSWLLLRTLYGRQSRLSRQQAQARQSFAADITERLHGLYAIKAAGETASALRSAIRRQDEMTSLEVGIGWSSGWITAINPMLVAVMVGGFWAWMRFTGASASGLQTLGGVGLLGLRAVSQLNNLVSSVGNLTRLAGSLPPVHGLTLLEPEPPRQTMPVPLAELRLEQVEYGYGARRVLDKVSLTARPGSLLVIAGPSGAGKSTLADLACGLTRPQAGRVVYRGRDGRDYDPSQWRARIGFVTQDVHLLSGTVRENLDPRGERRDDELEAALTAAGAWPFVSARGGLDAVLSEGGRSLSGGERRRLAIARVLASGADALFLDEVTNGLDAAVKTGLVATVAALARDRVVIAITHDLPAFAPHGPETFSLRPAP